MMKTKANPKEFIKEYLKSKGFSIKKINVITDEKPYLIVVEISNKLSIDKAVDLSIDLMRKLKKELNDKYQINVIPRV